MDEVLNQNEIFANVKVLIQIIKFKTKSTERQKPSFPTEFVENADLDKPIYTNE